MSDSFNQIYEIIHHIPSGKVATYGMVAKAWGKPRGAQVVGWALGAIKPGSTVPWQRVVAKDGRLSITNRHVSPQDQALALSREGVACEEREDSLWVVAPEWYTFSSNNDLV